MSYNKPPINPMEFDDDSKKGLGISRDPVSTRIKPILFDEPDKDFEEKTYIILCVPIGDIGNSFDGYFKICDGRTNCYEFIRNNIEDIDIHESVIITETKQLDSETSVMKYFMMALKDTITVYDFVKHIEKDYNDSFDIEEYNYAISDRNEKELMAPDYVYDRDKYGPDAFTIMNQMSSNGFRDNENPENRV